MLFTIIVYSIKKKHVKLIYKHRFIVNDIYLQLYAFSNNQNNPLHPFLYKKNNIKENIVAC